MKSIFVSHSSTDHGITAAVCQQLVLEPAGADAAFESVVDYDILVDYDRLVAAAEWPRQLHEWMARCHAGLVLLTPAALASDWVLKEATILSWRRCLDPDFRLFMVRYPGVTDETLKQAHFGPLRLRDVQWIGSTEPAAIAAAVRESLGRGDPPETLFERVVATLSALLADVKPDPLRQVAESVRAEAPAWRPDRDMRAQYIEEIARRLLSESLGNYGGVNELIDTLAQTAPTQTIRDVLRVVAPYWVDGVAAGVLPRLSSLDPRGTAAMNGERVVQYTAMMYVSRAHPLTLSWEYIPIPSASGGDIVAHVGREICKAIRRRENDDRPDDAVIEYLKDWLSPIYAGLPLVPPREDLESLRRMFPTVTFILATGPALQRATDLSDVAWLEPELDTTIERQQARSYSEAERIIRRKQGS